MAMSATGPSRSCLFFIKDRTSSEKFLVDTRAEVSVLPPSGPPSSRQPTGYSLQAANHSSIATYGTRSLTLDLGLRRTFRWIFIIADVCHAILGADFLHHFGLSVDVRQSRLTDTLTHLQVLGISTCTVSDGLTLPCLDPQDPYAAVLAEFPNLLSPRATEQPCQHDVMHQHTVTPLGSFSVPDARFDHVHLDIVGPFPTCKGYSYLLTCVDRFTRWPEAIPLVDTTASTIAHTFISGWIARYGTPSTITTDRGAQFESELWNQLMRLLGTTRIRTTAYHPAANGLVERLHRQLKAGLSTAPRNQWMDTLPLILLGLRSAFKEDLQCTTSELVYGTTLRLPGEFFDTTSTSNLPDQHIYVSCLRNTMQHIRPVPTSHHATRSTHVSKDLSTCTHVFIRHNAIRKSLQPPYDGPFKVIKRADKFYTILVNGHQQTISLDRLKPAHIDDSPSSSSSCALA